MNNKYNLLFLIAPGVIGIKWLIEKFISYIVRKEKERVKNLANERFAYDVATNHIPHIQDALRLIAKAVGVELPEPPPIRFIDPIDMPKDDKNN